MANAVQEAPETGPTTPAAPPAHPPMPAAPLPGAPPGTMPRSSRWTQVKAWVRLAYTDLGSKEHHVLLEWIIWMVIVSIVVTVIQHDAALEAHYHLQLRLVEALIFVAFATDYALNMTYAPSKRGYAFSFSGVVDVLAIVPSFLIFVDLSAIKFLRGLRFLRFLRILQVLKAVRHRQSMSGDEVENQSLLLDLQLAVIGISALLLLVPDDALRLALLVCVLFAAITTGLRRWLVYKQRPAAAILVLVASIVGAMVFATSLDSAGHQEWAVWLLVGTVLVAAITWSQIEAPAGI